MFKRVDRLIVCSLLIGLVQFGGGAALLKGVAANQAALTLPHQNEATRVALQRREEQPRRDGREEPPRKKEEWRREDEKRREEQRRRDEAQRREDERRREEQRRREDEHRQWQEKERRDWQAQQGRDYRRSDDRKQYDWSHELYRDANWRRTYFMYRSPAPFTWHESRSTLHSRFFTHGYRLEPVHDREWRDRFPGLRCYRWHDNGRHLGHFWYHARHIRVLMLYFDEWDELVGIGFMYDNVFVFIRDDHEVFHRNDAWLVGLAAILLAH